MSWRENPRRSASAANSCLKAARSFSRGSDGVLQASFQIEQLRKRHTAEIDAWRHDVFFLRGFELNNMRWVFGDNNKFLTFWIICQIAENGHL
jgi:hypothetical protein